MTVTLLDDRSVIQQVVREYDMALANGSGFTVTPDGVVVTATGVVQSSKDPRVYAANRVFAEYFKVKIPADFSRHSLDNPDLNRRLQACYPPQGQNSTCIANVTTKVTVFPNLSPPPPDGLPAQIISTGSSSTAPAILKVTKGGESENLPTVPLGTTLGPSIEPLDSMTTPARPTDKAPPKTETAHLDPPGSRTFKPEDRAKLDKVLSADGAGGAFIDDKTSEVVGFLAGGGDAATTITPIDDVRQALVSAGFTPRRGPVDVVFENALASYHNKFYAAAIPVLQQVLKLQPAHAVAQDHLRVATAQKGSAADAGNKPIVSASPVATQGSISPLIYVTGGIVVVGLLIAGAVPILLRRRQSRRDEEQQPQSVEVVPMAITSWPAHAATQVVSAPRPPDQGAMGPDSPPHGVLGSPALGMPELMPPSSMGSMGSPASPPQGRPQLKFCTQCGMRLGHGHRFCGFCGHPSDTP
ncbi:zinc ribbon domain-containing protein [Streptosporangiaceae bacterium NEAU-GS5]|nr:zinc ribbon domain-containing protein [Streptosporangiaceae bacterium NEAU-GS5]